MNPFLEYLQTSGQALGRGARALNQYVDPWQYLSPTTVAGFAPGGGVVQGNQDILAAKEAWGQGDYPRAVGLGAQSALNTGLDLFPMTAMLPAVSAIKPSGFAESVAKSKEHLAQTGDYLAGLEKELTDLIGPLPVKGYQGGISGAPKEDWSINPDPLASIPSADEAAEIWKAKQAELEQVPWTPQDQYKDVVEASFGTMDAGKAFYKEMAEKNITLDKDEVAMVNALWPEIPVKVDPSIAMMPAGTSWGPAPAPAPNPWWDEGVPEQRSRRLQYEDKAVGPPVPQRDLPMDPASVAQRQKAGDYWPETLYTGVPTWGDVQPRGFTDPQGVNPKTGQPYKDERAIFLSNEPPIAETYAAGHSGAHGPIFPVKARMQSPREVDWESWAGTPHFANEDMKALIDESIAQGYDSAIVRDMIDQGSPHPQTQYLVFSPNQLRSIYAKFDPKNIEANDLMAGIAAAFGLGAVAPHVLPEEAKR